MGGSQSSKAKAKEPRAETYSPILKETVNEYRRVEGQKENHYWPLLPQMDIGKVEPGEEKIRVLNSDDSSFSSLESYEIRRPIHKENRKTSIISTKFHRPKQSKSNVQRTKSKGCHHHHHHHRHHSHLPKIHEPRHSTKEHKKVSKKHKGHKKKRSQPLDF